MTAGPDGEVYLRATDEAINVLTGALDTDVESAQIAAEIKLANLIQRGRLSDAWLAAEQARHRTVQYAETLRRKLTRRDLRSVGWTREVPELIDEALAHISCGPSTTTGGTAGMATDVECQLTGQQQPTHTSRRGRCRFGDPEQR